MRHPAWNRAGSSVVWDCKRVIPARHIGACTWMRTGVLVAMYLVTKSSYERLAAATTSTDSRELQLAAACALPSAECSPASTWMYSVRAAKEPSKYLCARLTSLCVGTLESGCAQQTS